MDSPGLTPPMPLTEMVEPRTVPVDHDGGIVEVSNAGCAVAFTVVVFAVIVAGLWLSWWLSGVRA